MSWDSTHEKCDVLTGFIATKEEAAEGEEAADGEVGKRIILAPICLACSIQLDTGLTCRLYRL